ncbi:unnamed protein product [Leuciscus chuanchicus]
MESEVHALRKENKSLKASVQECRRYSWRWFLKLHGVAEKDNEDVRSVVLNILGKIAPGVGDGLQDSVDVVHRLGPKRTDGKTRSIIILFSQRRIRDIIWSAAKGCKFLTDNKLRLSEPLSPEDRAARDKLWPLVKKAREEGKKATFRNSFALIDGKHIFYADVVRVPHRLTKQNYGLGIITLFPSLRDPQGRTGYEYFYDGQKNTGFLSWRLKTVQRGTKPSANKDDPKTEEKGGPLLDRQLCHREDQLDNDQSLEAISLMNHTSDREILQDFTLLFGSESASRLFERWPTVFKAKACRSIQEHLEAEGNRQPYILATGSSKEAISQFFIVVDKKLIPCQESSSLAAIDELFKVHFVFSISYDLPLKNMYTFLQTTIYGIDVGTTKEKTACPSSPVLSSAFVLVLAPPHRGHPLLNWAMRTNQGRVSAVGFPLTPSPVPGHLQS